MNYDLTLLIQSWYVGRVSGLLPTHQFSDQMGQNLRHALRRSQGAKLMQKYTEGWSKWDRSKWDKIHLIGRWTFEIRIQAFNIVDPTLIYLEKCEQ